MKWKCQLTKPSWSPYVVGTGIGLLSVGDVPIHG